MEKRSSWEIDDIIYDRSNNSFQQIIEIINNKETVIKSFVLNKDGKYPYNSKITDYILYMDRYYVNLGKSKYWKVLYGAKDKNNTN